MRPAKSSTWELTNSLWIAWTFTIFLCFVAFFWIGARVKEKKWTKWGVVYLCGVLFLGPLGFLVGLISIIHAFSIREEYLLRLAALEAEDNSVDTQLAKQRAVRIPQPPQPATEPVSDQTPLAAPVDLNTASEEEMARLPGLNLVIAKKMVRVRETRGGFQSVEDFGEAAGLKPHVVERLRLLVVMTPVKSSQQTRHSGRVVDF